jgi:hypothetical protein
VQYRSLTFVLAAFVAALLAAPTGVSAQPCGNQVPGGNAEVDEYTETVPGACGNEQPGGSDGSGGSDSGSSLPPAASQALAALGPAGQGVADFAEATAPDGGGNDSGTGSEGSGSAGGSGASAVIDAAGGSDDGGLGIVLPLILGGVAVAGLTYAVMRRRGGQGPA